MIETTETPTSQDLYTCDGCSSAIPTHLARISCHTCASYHLCSNCFVVKSYSLPHTEQHSTMVFKMSGYVVPPPPGFARRDPPPLPPRNRGLDTLGKSAGGGGGRVLELETKLPTANWGALWSVLKAPLEKKDKSKDQAVKNNSEAALPSVPEVEKSPQSRFEITPLTKIHSLNEFPPTLPQSSVAKAKLERLDSTAPSYPRPEAWELMFESDESRTPRPIFVALMSTIFSHLDPRHTGYLSPEVWAGFLDVMGVVGEENVWQNAFGKGEGYDVADLELALYFSDLEIPYTLATRHKDWEEEEVEELKSAVEERIKERMNFGANMPMLSRQGFVNLGKRLFLADPEAGFEYLGTVVECYGVWKELGQVPRWVLLEGGEIEEDREEEKEEKPPLPSRSTFGMGGKADGGEKEVEPLLTEDDGDDSTSKTADGLVKVIGGEEMVEVLSREDGAIRYIVSESPIKVKGGDSKVEALLTGEKWDESATESISESPVEVTKKGENIEIVSPGGKEMMLETEKDGEKLLEPSVEELEAISLQEETGEGYREVEKQVLAKEPHTLYNAD